MSKPTHFSGHRGHDMKKITCAYSNSVQQNKEHHTEYCFNIMGRRPMSPAVITIAI